MIPFDPEKITYFAKTDARGAYVPFGIKAKDRQRHMYVIGKTGMGKSTLLENMAAQDIMNGEGMAFIDPHGSAAETLLEYIPEHRLNDVVYFAPFDTDNPIAFNVMEDVGVDKRHLVVSGLMSTFKKIWVDAWSARMEYILTNALLALIEYPDTTLLSVNRMFVDKEFRLKVVEYCKDPAVKAYWTDEFANYTERFAAEALPAIQNKIGQFTGNPLIRNIIGQPNSSFDIRQMMDDKKILIMNLSKGLIGETNANLLGSMLTTRIYLAAMSRADLPVDVMKKMPNFYFYVDEFQSFANSTFANILSEARKYHLNLIIAHQYVDQMEEDVRSAVFGNVGTTIAFRVGPFDAEVLETVFSPQFLAVDLVNLGFAQIYLSLMIDGVGSQPFSAVTLPPLERPPVSYRDMAISGSRTNYAKRRNDVEQIVIDLHTPTPKKVNEDRRQPKKPQGGNNVNGNNHSNGQSAQRPIRQVSHVSESENRRPAPKPVVPAKSPEDLKTILSRMSQTNAIPEKKETKVESPAKVDLKSALASVLKTEEPVVSAPPVVRAPIQEHKEAPPPPPAPSLPRREMPSFTPSSVKNNLDPTVIKRMLRDEKQERSPFS
ncbi:MAG: type IV secretion system DNA-binding domain-containing protein [Candidatus Pacebacteria bacterium]|nr:type IV secretion system DNA-binding domain-containing protein [Candidatus Paceibacterota bacterium]